MDQPIKAELEPSKSVFTDPELLLYFFLVLAVGVSVAVEPGPKGVLVATLAIVVFGVTFRFIYLRSHKCRSTYAWLEGGQLMIRDPNPWWSRIRLIEGRNLDVEIYTVSTDGEALVVTGHTEGLLSTERQIRVRLCSSTEEVRQQL